MTTIITKNSSTAGAAPTASDLVQGELAVNVTDKALYTENASGTVVKLNAPSIVDNGNATAITIDSSENVGIGTSSPTTKLHTYVATGAVTSKTQSGNTGQAAVIAQNSRDYIQIAVDSANCYLDAGTSSPLLIYTGGAERARIDSSGNLLVGTTSVQAGGHGINTYYSASGVNTNVSTVGDTSGTAYHWSFYRGTSAGTETGSIRSSGSTTSYNTSSDYRLKENVQPMTGALATVAQLKPCTYTWKADGSDGQGFIAHELQEVVPDAVSGEKDAVNEDGSIKPQGIDTSFLVATLTAAIQELNAKVDAQAAEIAALKGQA